MYICLRIYAPPHLTSMTTRSDGTKTSPLISERYDEVNDFNDTHKPGIWLALNPKLISGGFVPSLSFSTAVQHRF